MSATFDDVSEMLVVIAEQLDAAGIEALAGEGSWSIQLDTEDQLELTLQFDEHGGRLVLSASLAAPPDERREATYAFLLAYNFAYAETGGVWTAIDPADGEAFALVGLALAEITAERLAKAIADFIGVLRSLQVVVASGVENKGGDSMATPDPALAPGHHLRV